MSCNSVVVPGANTDTGFTLSIEFRDVDGNVIDMSGGTYVADLYDAQGGTSQYSFSGANVTITGTSNEVVNFIAPDSHAIPARSYYFQANKTDGGVTWIATGSLKVAATGDVSEFSLSGVK